MATILIVDDRPTNREVLVALLGFYGHRLIEAIDGLHGLEIARAEHPDLIITDLLMPNLDGFALVRELRADPTLALTPVIFCTAAYLEAETSKLAQACGVHHILIKPLEPQDVIHAVDSALHPSPIHTTPRLAEEFMLQHLHLLINKLYQKVTELESSNGELKKRSAELTQANTRLQSLSLTDGLTGLYNRRGFFELAAKQLKLIQRTQSRFCLIYMDVDNLKIINDKFGHQAGDATLLRLSEILRQTFRDSDILARLGGDEFAVLVVDAGETHVEVVQKRLQTRLDTFNAHSQSGYLLSVSLGTLWVDSTNSQTIEALIDKADAAMYIQKQQKKHAQHPLDVD